MKPRQPERRSASGVSAIGLLLIMHHHTCSRLSTTSRRFSRLVSAPCNQLCAAVSTSAPQPSARVHRAVGQLAADQFYKLGAGLAGQVSFGTKFPDVGGLGAFGIQGMDQITEGLEMKKVSEAYNFKPGRIYNLESSDIIKNGGGAVGAHSDIAHPEVAHALWQAVLAG